MLTVIDQSAVRPSPRERIVQHERIVRAGAAHCSDCPGCNAPCHAFKRQRYWLRTIRFFEFDAAAQAQVVQAVKITIARFVCTSCLHPWTDYPDFRPSS